RRHTRWPRDWSSDVCSSDLVRRRPISPRFLSIVQTGCAILIIGYILYITFYDVQDLPWRRTREKPAEIKFEPKQELAPAPQTPRSEERRVGKSVDQGGRRSI